MAAGTTGIWNHLSNAHALGSTDAVRANATGSSGGSGSSTTASAGISANDFLTLLVTEMQNQDPTANTDPNEYINQLVQVNSLEQLISINQTLTTDSLAGASGGSKNAKPEISGAAIGNAVAVDRPTPSMQPALPDSAVRQLVSGNLTVPAANPAAQRVAKALSGEANVQ